MFGKNSEMTFGKYMVHGMFGKDSIKVVFGKMVNLVQI